ncbi:hypothetical protein F5Y09DRAFT_241060 [Xylaria sp. FL1042]|nr:hypothetical protein F5Y09DRAFT_241060 [Xylaria sp. FL1042]
MPRLPRTVRALRRLLPYAVLQTLLIGPRYTGTFHASQSRHRTTTAQLSPIPHCLLNTICGIISKPGTGIEYRDYLMQAVLPDEQGRRVYLLSMLISKRDSCRSWVTPQILGPGLPATPQARLPLHL